MSDQQSGGTSELFVVLGTESAYLGLFDAAGVAREYAGAEPGRQCYDASGRLLEAEGADGWTAGAGAPQDEEVRAGVGLVLKDLDETLAPLRRMVDNGAPAAEVIAELDKPDKAPVADDEELGDPEGIGKKIKKVLGGLF